MDERTAVEPVNEELTSLKEHHGIQEIPFSVAAPLYINHQVAAAAEHTTADPQIDNTSEFQCIWNGCREDCKNQRALVLHLAQHLNELDW